MVVVVVVVAAAAAAAVVVVVVVVVVVYTRISLLNNRENSENIHMIDFVILYITTRPNIYNTDLQKIADVKFIC